MLQYAYRCPHKPDWCHTKQIGTINSLCGVGKGQNYIKLLSTSHKPQSAPVTKADPGVMIQTTLGMFALYHLQSDTVLATQHNTKLHELHPVRFTKPIVTLFRSTFIYAFTDSIGKFIVKAYNMHINQWCNAAERHKYKNKFCMFDGNNLQPDFDCAHKENLADPQQIRISAYCTMMQSTISEQHLWSLSQQWACLYIRLLTMLFFTGNSLTFWETCLFAFLSTVRWKD